MIAVAVVGPICSGKSTVLNALAELGAATCSADDIARELTEVGRPELREIFVEFGDTYRCGDGALDRRALAKLIFSDRLARERLEAILHPAILERIAEWLAGQRAAHPPPPAAAVEILRLPAHLNARSMFDQVWFCRADEETRVARLKTRDALDEAAAQRRLAAQAEQGVDACRPDVVIATGGDLGLVLVEVRRLWEGLLRSAAN